MNSFKGIIHKLTEMTEVLANAVIFLTMAIVSLSILMRVFLKSPLAGLTDYVSMLNALTVAFAVSVTERMDKHIRVDFVREFLPPRIGKGIYVLTRVMMLAVYTLVSYRFLLYFISALRHGNKTWIAGLLHWPVLFCLFIGLSIFLLTAIINLVSALSNWEGRKKTEVAS